jgi:hypothetical protein
VPWKRSLPTYRGTAQSLRHTSLRRVLFVLLFISLPLLLPGESKAILGEETAREWCAYSGHSVNI